MSTRLDLATDEPPGNGDGTDLLGRRSHSVTQRTGEHERSPTGQMPVVNPAPGCCIDRYVVLRRLGRTRHSDIYAAHDPELDRKVALKLMSPDVVDEQDAYRRLMAEAQATARLAHPNMVKVHDVGSWNGRPYIAREFVEGSSVHTWKLRKRPSKGELLRVMLMAGRGLSALHAAGLVHRDLNLHSVLVGDDGCVRVTDMDYVGSVETLALPSAVDGDTFDSREFSMDSRELSVERDFNSSDSGDNETSSSFVRAAGLSGVFDDSPYASPEQLMGRIADARSDQFSFCMALYEALYDALPFGRGTAPRRLVRMERGKVRTPECSYSRRVFNAIKRGLAAEPNERYPSMDALLKALAPRRRRYAILAPFAVGAASLAGVALMPDDVPDSYCESIDDRLDGVWDESRANDLREAFSNTGLAYADDLHTFVSGELQTWADGWVDRQRQLCQAQAEAAPNEVGPIARQMHCLSLRRGELTSVVDTLIAADTRTIENAAQVVRGLGDLDSCSDPSQWLGSREQDDDAAQLGRGLARLRTLVASGRAEEALPLAEVLVDQARGLGHGPSLVRALGLRAHLLDVTRSPESEAALHEALSEGLAQGEYGAVASSATKLASSLARQRKFEEASRWLDHAEAALAQGNLPEEPGYSGVENVRGRMATLQGDFDEALLRYKRALQLRVDLLGADDDRVALHRVNLGQAYQDLGRYAEARGEYEAAIVGLEGALGSEHPNVARAHMALCTVMSEQNEYEPALEHGRAAQRILEQAYGVTRPVVADAMLSTAFAYSSMGQHQESILLQKRALEVYRATIGDRSYRVSLALNNLGVENYNSGNYVEAERYYREALDRVVEILGKDHVNTARMEATLVQALLVQGRYDEAQPILDKALAQMIDKVGPDHPMLAFALSYSAELHAVAGRHAEAVADLERAVKLALSAGGDAVEINQNRLMLAGELRRAGRDAEADITEASADEALTKMGIAGTQARAESERFADRVTAALAAK